MTALWLERHVEELMRWRRAAEAEGRADLVNQLDMIIANAKELVFAQTDRGVKTRSFLKGFYP